MGIFLGILKIVGIVLLCILAFLLAAVLLILFVPYRYKVRGQKKDGISAYAKVTWLLHFVVVLLTYDDGINLRIKILGIPFYDKKKRAQKAKFKEEKAREKERLKARRKKKDPLPDEKEEKEPESAEDKTEEVNTAAAENETLSGSEEGAKDSADEDRDSTEPKEGKSAEKNKKKSLKDIFTRKKKISFFEWLDEIADKTEDILYDLPDMIEEGGDVLFEKLEGIKEKVSSLFDTIEYYHRLLGSEGAEWVYEYVKKHVIGILKAVKPTRFDAEVNIADDDPASVAKVYEYEVFAMPFIELIRGRRGKVYVNAYQDEKYFDFEADLRGRVLLFALAWHGALILFNKKVKYFIKRLKREEEAEEKKNG